MAVLCASPDHSLQEQDQRNDRCFDHSVCKDKVHSDALYPCSKEDGKDEDVAEDDKLKNKKGKKKRHKSTAPNSITKPGTYYRIFNTYMAEQTHPDVVNIGLNPTMTDLDSCHFLHKSIYDRLLLS